MIVAPAPLIWCNGSCVFGIQVTHYNNPKLLAEVSENLGEAMVGLTMCVSISLFRGHAIVLTIM